MSDLFLIFAAFLCYTGECEDVDYSISENNTEYVYMVTPWEKIDEKTTYYSSEQFKINEKNIHIRYERLPHRF